MPRRRAGEKRDIPPDPMYHSEMAQRFINKIMGRGKKQTAEKIFYGAMDIIEKKTGKEPLPVFERAIKNVMPVLEVKSRRVGGATYQVPIEVRPDRKRSLAITWILQFARARGGKTMAEKLAGEFMDASNSTGASIKKREDTHKMAEANKAYSHYRW